MVVSIDRMPDATIEPHNNTTTVRLVAFGAKDGCHAPGMRLKRSGGWGDGRRATAGTRALPNRTGTGKFNAGAALAS